MDDIVLDCVLQEKESKKGNTYYAIVINLTDNVQKTVFLEKAEAELIKLTYGDR